MVDEERLMKKKSLVSIVALFFSFANQSFALELPSKFTMLNDYIVKAPNQGQANTCLFMAATGAMEILLAKKMGVKDPEQGSVYDLSERYTINAPLSSYRSKSWFEDAFLKFDSGEAVLNRDMPFESFDEDGNMNDMWSMPSNYNSAPRIKLPKVDTVYLFSFDRYSRGVLNDSYVRQVKEALVKYESPIITVGNDEDYWHVTVITGYDDNLVGDCYELDSSVCVGKKGVFYVRDSFGIRVEARSYEWFMRRQNSAAVAKLQE